MPGAEANKEGNQDLLAIVEFPEVLHVVFNLSMGNLVSQFVPELGEKEVFFGGVLNEWSNSLDFQNEKNGGC